MSDSQAKQLLLQFGADPTGWQYLGGAGGFSGARFWRGPAFGELHVLRLWPVGHPSRIRLQFIHDALAHAAAAGFRQCPLPIRHPKQGAIMESAEGLWQLEPWMPGEADFHLRPSRDKVVSALQALASFHEAMQDWGAQTGHPPAVVERIERLEHLAQALPLLGMAPAASDSNLQFAQQALPEFVALARPLVESVKQRLLPLSKQTFPLRPSIRDIWSDHVLFDRDGRVSLVDFGAMRLDWALPDAARLLGSMDLGAGEYWQTGLQAYCDCLDLQLEPTGEYLAAIDAANVLLGPYHWLNWLLFERRQFESMDLVRQRLATAMLRLRRLAGADGLLIPDA